MENITFYLKAISTVSVMMMHACTIAMLPCVVGSQRRASVAQNCYKDLIERCQSISAGFEHGCVAADLDHGAMESK